MADVTIHRQGEIVQEVFKVLLAHPEGMAAQDVISSLRSTMTLTDHEKSTYKSGGLAFDKIVRFATIPSVKAGWMTKEKGRWTLTDLGRDAYAKHKSPEAFHRAAYQLYKEWKRSRKAGETGVIPEDDEEATSTAAITFEQAEEQAWAEVADYLTSMNPYDLQKLVAALLRAMGYHVSWIAPPGKDGGLDILAWNDPLGTRPPRIKVQVKRHDAAIGVSDLRSFMAILGEGDVGIFVCTGGFSKDAQDEARTQQTRKVTLLDLEKLYELWVEHYSKIDQDSKEYLPLKPIYFLAPEG